MHPARLELESVFVLLSSLICHLYAATAICSAVSQLDPAFKTLLECSLSPTCIFDLFILAEILQMAPHVRRE